MKVFTEYKKQKIVESIIEYLQWLLLLGSGSLSVQALLLSICVPNLTFLTALCFFASLIHLIINNKKGLHVNIPLGHLVMLIPRFYATV